MPSRVSSARLREATRIRAAPATAAARVSAALRVKALLDGVRKHGSYKRYMRAPHRDVLACRGLAQRGKLATEHCALSFLAKQGDNGIVWTVLSYWRATS